MEQAVAEGVVNRLAAVEKQLVNFKDVEKIWEKEMEMAAEKGIQDFKFNSRETMIDIVKKP